MVKIRLNASEAQLIEALVNYTGEEAAPMCREMLLEQARHVLFGGMNSMQGRGGNEVHEKSLSVA